MEKDGKRGRQENQSTSSWVHLVQWSTQKHDKRQQKQQQKKSGFTMEKMEG